MTRDKKVICPSCQGNNPPGKNGCGRCEGTGVIRASESHARKPVKFTVEKTRVTSRIRTLNDKWGVAERFDQKVTDFLTQLEKVTHKETSGTKRGVTAKFDGENRLVNGEFELWKPAYSES